MISEALKNRLTEDFNIEVVNARPESGGDINRAFRILAKEGDYFLKYNTTAPYDFFEKEAHGLQKLSESETGLRIPKVIAVGKPNPKTPGFSGRVSLYNLYPLFVHANLFGGHYISQVEHQLQQF